VTVYPKEDTREGYPKLTVGSLFSGLDGLSLGLETTGAFHTVWHVEQDETCREQLSLQWAHSNIYTDVRNVGRRNLAPVDVICGGFPCQDVSLANNYAPQGLDGGKSGLWSEFARIIRELRPRYVIVENTPGLLVRGIDRVLGDLAELLYDAEGTVLSACAVGASHTRERLFILAHTDRFTGLQAHPAANTLRSGWTARYDAYRADWGEIPASDWAIPEAVSVGAIDGIPRRLERARALGNAVCPPVARVIGEWLLEVHAQLNQSEAA
jgi:DNA (cytosine-5)-methyltransferase 1